MDESHVREPIDDAIRSEAGPSGTGADRASRRAGGRRLTGLALAAGLLVALGGCTEAEIGQTNPTKTARMDVDFEVPGTSSSSSRGSAVSASVTVSDDPALTIDSVDVAIREVQIGRQGTECLFSDVGSSGGGGGDGTDCVEATGGTVLQTLPVDDGLLELVNEGFLEPGTFDRMAFEFNVLELDDTEATSILDDRGDMEDASVFVGGTYEGQDFEIRLDPDVEVVVSADEPLTLEDEQQGRAVLIWNVAQWFVDPDDGGIEDPTQVAGDDQLEQQIEDRIVATMEVRFD